MHQAQAEHFRCSTGEPGQYHGKMQNMNHQQERDEIFNLVRRACDTFRGVIDPGQYKDSILTMLFVKYLSDIHQSKLAEYEKQYQGDAVRIDRAMGRQRFIVPPIHCR